MKKISLVLYILLSFYFPVNCQTTGTDKKDFKIYTLINYLNTPDLSKLGFHKIYLFGESDLLDIDQKFPKDDKKRFLSETKLKNISKQNLEPDVPVCLDVESWKMSDPATKAVSTPKYENIIAKFTSQNPQVKYVSFFSHVVNPKGVLFPSFYTIDKNREYWKNIAIRKIRSLRRRYPNLKIYAFMWPQYNPNNKLKLAYTFIDADYWKFQLETLYPLVDGIVIWTQRHDMPYMLRSKKYHPIEFNENMPFFKATLEFMKKHNIK